MKTFLLRLAIFLLIIAASFVLKVDVPVSVEIGGKNSLPVNKHSFAFVLKSEQDFNSLALSFVTGVTAVAAVIINYIKKDEVVGTWLESHFRWQIRTFWFGLLWSVVGLILMVLVVGYFVILANMIWIIYRIAKGWMKLSENKPV